jgi:RNA polymerase primary sigma factor
MRKTTYLSNDEQRELIKLGQAGDTEARNKVIMNFHNLIYKQAEYYCRFNKALVHDCAQVCIVRLIEKFHLFDLERGVKFITWAFNWIRQAGQEFFAEHRTVIKTGRNKHNCTASLLGKIHAAERIKQGSIPVQVGVHMVPLQSLIECYHESHAEIVERRDDAELTQRILERLEPRYQFVLRGRSEDRTLRDISQDLGLSKERVRQIETDAKDCFVRVALRVARPTVERLSQHGALAS